MLAARPATLPAAAVPVLVGAGAALGEGAIFKPLIFMTTMACALLIQIGTNFANDFSDFHRGADHEGRLGPVRVTQSGLITEEGVRRGIIVAFGLALVLGLYLAYVGGWPIILIGSLSILAGLAYTGGPFPFGYHGLGDIFVFVFFGLIAVTGTAYLQTGTWSSFALLLAIPIGLLVTNILVINNLRDLPTDSVAGKRTLAVRMGDRATRMQYSLFIALAYIIPLSRVLGYHHDLWLMLPWITLPFAVFLASRVLSPISGRELNPILKLTGQLLLAFGVLLAIGAALGRP